MSVGGPPGISTRAEVFSVKDDKVTFKMKVEDADYFKRKSTGALAFWPGDSQSPAGSDKDKGADHT
jgi:hypothetical protein